MIWYFKTSACRCRAGRRIFLKIRSAFFTIFNTKIWFKIKKNRKKERRCIYEVPLPFPWVRRATFSSLFCFYFFYQMFGIIFKGAGVGVKIGQNFRFSSTYNMSLFGILWFRNFLRNQNILIQCQVLLAQSWHVRADFVPLYRKNEPKNQKSKIKNH